MFVSLTGEHDNILCPVDRSRRDVPHPVSVVQGRPCLLRPHPRTPRASGSRMSLFGSNSGYGSSGTPVTPEVCLIFFDSDHSGYHCWPQVVYLEASDVSDRKKGRFRSSSVRLFVSLRSRLDTYNRTSVFSSPSRISPQMSSQNQSPEHKRLL